MKTIITKSLRDILSKDVLLFILKIGVISMSLSVAIVWMFWDNLSSAVGSFLGWVPWEWAQEVGVSIVNILLAYILFVITVSIFTSLMSEGLLKKLVQKHYPNMQISGSSNIIKSVWLILKAIAVFLVLFVIAIPILFVPVIGQIAMLYLWSILIKEPTLHDITSLLGIEDQKSFSSISKTTMSMTASLFNYIPMINLFAPIFAQILFLHFALSLKSSQNEAGHQWS